MGGDPLEALAGLLVDVVVDVELGAGEQTGGDGGAVGGLGAPTAVISLETPNGPAPNWLTPRTSNVYFCPGFSPVTVRVVVGAMFVVLTTVVPDFTTKS